MHRFVFGAIALLVGIQAAAGIAALPSIADTTLIDISEGEVSNGSGPHMRSGQNSQGFRLRAALRFDIAAGVPAGSTIESVTLILHNSGPDNAPNNLPRQIEAHRLLNPWGEGGSSSGGGQGAPAAPGDVTWIHRFYNPADPVSSPMWDTPGGDFEAVSSAAMNVAGSGYYSWSAPGMADDVQLWLDQPEDDHGWLLLGDESTITTAKKFDTRESGNESLRPVLLIEYSSGPSGGDDEEDDEVDDGEVDRHDAEPVSRSRSGSAAVR